MTRENGWQTVTLGDIIAPVRRPVTIADDRSYKQVTVRIKGRGLTSRGETSGAAIATKRQYEVREGDLLVSKIDARNGGLGLVPAELHGAVVSSDFPAYGVNTDVCIPRYLDLYVKRPAFWDECLLVSEGSTNRVRLIPEQFLSLEIELPPLQQQADVVAASNSLRSAAEAKERVARAAAQARAVAREELFSPHEVVEVGELLEGIEGGRSPKAANRPPRAGEAGVLKVSAIRPGDFRSQEAKALSPDTKMPERALVVPGDLLVNRASGSVALLCSACVVEAVPPSTYLSDKTLRLRTLPRVDARCLAEAFALRSTREQVEMEADGTSGAKNLSQGDISGIEVPWPSSGLEQEYVTDTLTRLGRLAGLAHREASAARTLEATLVDEMVTGARRPPSLGSDGRSDLS